MKCYVQLLKGVWQLMIESPYRHDFPFFDSQKKKLKRAYLDSAATTQKPSSVIEELVHFYTKDNANIYRGIYATSQRATSKFEAVRDKVKTFINASERTEIIFTKGTTQSLNWIVFGYFWDRLHSDDEILISVMEHHSNLVPWQQLAIHTGAKLNYVNLDEDQQLDIDDFKAKLNSRVKVVALTHVSNVLGCLNPVTQITTLAHKFGAKVVIDGAQAIGHMSVDVQEINCDFYAFSGHKAFAPTGVGVLYGKKELLEKMTPLEYGGEMISDVNYQNTSFKELPLRLEAGTQNISGVIGLGAALDYLNKCKLNEIECYIKKLTKLAFEQLISIPEVIIYGSKKASFHQGIISFNIKGIHPHDVATVLDIKGVEIRAGHHCAQVLMRYLKIPACLRLSLHIYNDETDIQQLIIALHEVLRFFKHGS